MKLRGRLALAPLASLVLAGCGFWSGSVTRVYSGQAVEERYIPPEAYAHYAQGAIFEASGRDRDALLEYERAAEDDPDSADIYTRLGALHCRIGSARAERLFARAEELDASFAPLSRERARCALSKGDASHAVELARRAVALDPDDEASSIVLSSALVKLGKSDEARRWLTALVLRAPRSSAAQQALDALAAPPAAPAETKSADLGELDRALSEGDTAKARSLAHALGLSASTVALRAAALGRADLARSEAERVLAADPDDADAFIAALVAASLERDEARLEALGHALGAEPLTPSPLGIRLLAEVIARRVGRAASRAWRESWAPLPAPKDALEARVEARATGSM